MCERIVGRKCCKSQRRSDGRLKAARVAQGADEAVVRLKVTSVGLNCRAKCRCGLIGAAFGEQVKPSLA